MVDLKVDPCYAPGTKSLQSNLKVPAKLVLSSYYKEQYISPSSLAIYQLLLVNISF